MAKEYKTLTFHDDWNGRQRMAETINLLPNEGWSIKSKETAPQDRSHGSTCCLGCILLPIRSKKKSLITLIMERDIDPNRKSTEHKESNTLITNPDVKPWYKKWWIILIIAFFGMCFLAAIVGRISNLNSPATTQTNQNQDIKSQQQTTNTGLDEFNDQQNSNDKPLDITASYDALAMYITNNETNNLTGCKFTLNNDYKYESGTTFLMTAGQKGEFYLSDFTKSDGTRFNAYQIKPQYLSVLCHRPDGSSDFADIFWD